jgi:hypothetical protein
MNNPSLQLDPDIRRKLASVRRRIRLYVFVEGVSLAIVWLGLTFWIGLAIDYLPILVGATEMPGEARAVLLCIVAVVLAIILYRWVLRRTFVRLADRSMAVLLERQFEDFHDSLVTTVEMKEHPDHARDFNPEMLQHADEDALSAIQDIRIGSIFNARPLAWKLTIACLLALTMVGFYVTKAEAFNTWISRLYVLDVNRLVLC